MTPSHVPPGLVWNVKRLPFTARTPSAPSASGRSVRRWSVSSRSSPARAGRPPRLRCLWCRLRRRSWIDLLKEGTEVGEPIAPEGAVVAHPVGQRLEAFGPDAVVDLPAPRAFGPQTRPP